MKRHAAPPPISLRAENRIHRRRMAVIEERMRTAPVWQLSTLADRYVLELGRAL